MAAASRRYTVATRNEYREAVVEYLIEAGAKLNAIDHEGRTPLHAAAQTLRCEAVLRKLVKSGADVNATDYNGSTPLHLAALQGNLNIAIYLAIAGARIHSINKSGTTPLSLVRTYGSLFAMYANGITKRNRNLKGETLF